MRDKSLLPILTGGRCGFVNGDVLVVDPRELLLRFLVDIDISLHYRAYFVSAGLVDLSKRQLLNLLLSPGLIIPSHLEAFVILNHLS